MSQLLFAVISCNLNQMFTSEIGIIDNFCFPKSPLGLWFCMQSLETFCLHHFTNFPFDFVTLLWLNVISRLNLNDNVVSTYCRNSRPIALEVLEIFADTIENLDENEGVSEKHFRTV